MKLSRYQLRTLEIWRKPSRADHFTFIWLCAVLVLLVSGSSAFAASVTLTHANGIEVRSTPNPVSNGHAVLLEISAHGLKDPIVGIQAWHNGKAVPVIGHPQKGPAAYIGFIGISYYRKPEPFDVKLEWTDRDGYHFMQIPIEVTMGVFIKEKLRVPKSKVSPSKSDRRRITGERFKIKEIYNTPHPFRLWAEEFAVPATGKITSPFGSQRVLNGKMKSYHNGVDFRAPIGTPIYAANAGIVRFADNLFYSGNHLIIDHGLGLCTGYSHLSSFTVETGQRVSKGQQVGLAGATGRVNGPHLHWAAKVNGVSVDPMQLKGLINSLFVEPPSDPVTESE